MSEISVSFNKDTGYWEAERDGFKVSAATPQEAAELVQKQTLQPEDIDWITP